MRIFISLCDPRAHKYAKPLPKQAASWNMVGESLAAVLSSSPADNVGLITDDDDGVRTELNRWYR